MSRYLNRQISVIKVISFSHKMVEAGFEPAPRKNAA